MNLYTHCKNCKFEIDFSISARDRFVLARKLGEQIDLNCNSCGTWKQYHVNEIKAEENKIISLMALLILFGGTIGIFIYLWRYIFNSSGVLAVAGLLGVLTIPFLVYQAINSSQSNKVDYFNSKKYI